MRPRRLVSVRANQTRRLASYLFRAVDVLALTVLTVIMVDRASSRAIFSTSLRLALPFVVGAIVLGALIRWMSLYRFVRSDSLPRHLIQLVEALAISTGAVFLLDRALSPGPSARSCWEFAALAAVVVGALHVVWWSIIRSWREAGWLTPNLVIVGATDYAEHVIGEALARRHVNVLGVFDDRLERSPQSLLGVPVLGDLDALIGHPVMPFVDRIVIAVEPTATKRVRELSTRLASLPNEVTLFLAADGATDRAAALSRLEDSPLAELNRGADPDRHALAKRLQDLVIGVPLLVAISPLLLMIGLLIKIDSSGAMFFRQRRHGFNNEEILVWKFRSMRADAADARAERQVTADDDRVTRVGRFLRKASLDELPQLINVVKGEMSLVGPRPHAIGMKTGDVESALLVAEYAQRHRIKPGMTGWAAINGSRGPLHTPEEVQRRVELDVDYIARNSLRLDLRIMAMTIPGLLGDRHAIR